jgi:hypothetical protein
MFLDLRRFKWEMQSEFALFNYKFILTFDTLLHLGFPSTYFPRSTFFFSSQTKTKTSFYCDERSRKVWGEKCHDQILPLLLPRHHRVYAFCICCHYDELERYRRINGNGWVEGRKKDKRAEREWDTVWHLDNLRDIKMEK